MSYDEHREASAENACYHALNRGHGRGEVFHKPEDYAAFLKRMVIVQFSATVPLPWGKTEFDMERLLDACQEQSSSCM